MPRARTDKSHNKLPKYVYPGRTHWEWRPTKPRKRTVKLVPLDASQGAVWTAYNEAVTKEERAGEQNLRWLMMKFIESPQFKLRNGNGAPKTPQTLNRQRANINVMLRTPLPDTQYTVGDIELVQITVAMWTRYMQSRQDTPAAANHCRSLVLGAFKWALQRDMLIGVPANPIPDSYKYQIASRPRYITDEEYLTIYTTAKEKCYPYFAPYLEVVYLTGSRRGEVTRLKWSDITPNPETGGLVGGVIFMKRQKGSRPNYTKITDRLAAALEEARSQGTHPSDCIFIHRGQPVHWNHPTDEWTRMCEKFLPAEVKDVQLRDLRRKGATDSKKENRQTLLGVTNAVLPIYDKAIDTVPATR